MNITEDQVKAAIASILSNGLIRITNTCRQDPVLAHAEAYHLHNLPGFMRGISIGPLKYYAEIERPEYLRSAGEKSLKMHEENWKIIDAYLKENQPTQPKSR